MAPQTPQLGNRKLQGRLTIYLMVESYKKAVSQSTEENSSPKLQPIYLLTLDREIGSLSRNCLLKEGSVLPEEAFLSKI